MLMGDMGATIIKVHPSRKAIPHSHNPLLAPFLPLGEALTSMLSQALFTSQPLHSGWIYRQAVVLGKSVLLALDVFCEG
eukprot:417224-Amphidinium_carterae.1